MINITTERMANVFDEWALRYSEDPESFDNILDEDGNPVKNYGQACAIYFTQINNELE